ncbi:hypothetical protein H696_04251 [Fonticula alba]|uniref:Uncharacterized protein n=1 Tax=Fonticula alba TaxID=691883 RepID=A0A058Z4H9_FONAL|nr:hypothetical protein H696_04251 [Fonticula alba]KCV68833.1 hypothetical protein H696_04251 [Fonticula alba]|eukprot:XP_009496404.1 hypothetical protein H696_04251 [Fonticula alba]
MSPGPESTTCDCAGDTPGEGCRSRVLLACFAPGASRALAEAAARTLNAHVRQPPPPGSGYRPEADPPDADRPEEARSAWTPPEYVVRALEQARLRHRLYSTPKKPIDFLYKFSVTVENLRLVNASISDLRVVPGTRLLPFICGCYSEDMVAECHTPDDVAHPDNIPATWKLITLRIFGLGYVHDASGSSSARIVSTHLLGVRGWPAASGGLRYFGPADRPCIHYSPSEAAAGLAGLRPGAGPDRPPAHSAPGRPAHRDRLSCHSRESPFPGVDWLHMDPYVALCGTRPRDFVHIARLCLGRLYAGERAGHLTGSFSARSSLIASRQHSSFQSQHHRFKADARRPVPGPLTPRSRASRPGSPLRAAGVAAGTSAPGSARAPAPARPAPPYNPHQYPLLAELFLQPLAPVDGDVMAALQTVSLLRNDGTFPSVISRAELQGPLLHTYRRFLGSWRVARSKFTVFAFIDTQGIILLDKVCPPAASIYASCDALLGLSEGARACPDRSPPPPDRESNKPS